MSRLSELIAELCPDGVEYSTLDESCFYPRERRSIDDLDEGTYVSVENLAQDFGGLTGEVATTKPGTAVIRFHEGDVLVGNIRPYLKKVWLADFDGGTNGDVLVFRIKDSYSERLLPEFVYMQLASESFIDFDMKYAKGAKMPRGDKRAVLRYRIPVPPIEVQREVVRILDEYTATHDELVRQLEEEIHLQAHLRQAMHDEIVEKAIVGNEMISLGNVCQITDGDHQPPPKTELGIPFVTISCIDQRRMIDYSQASFVSDDYYKSLDESRRPLKGDVLLTVVGTLGVPVRVMNESPFVVQRHIAIMRPSKTVDQGFLYHYVSWSKFHSDAVAAATGSAQKTIGLRYLRKVEFPDIPMDEQILVSTQLDRLEHESVELKGRLTDDIELINQQLTLVRNQLLSFPEKVA